MRVKPAGRRRPCPARVCFALGAALALTGLSGCASQMLAKIAVDAPNRESVPPLLRNSTFVELVQKTYAQTWQVEVGPPAARLAVAVVEPADYTFKHRLWYDEKDGRARLRYNLTWEPPAKNDGTNRIEPKGTVLLLHGYRDSKENVLHWGLFLAEHGYRCVLVDLRGHGASSGERIGFGAFEAADLSRVLDDVYARGLARGPVGVLGISYGASTALLLASRDERVATVVSLEPYSEGDKAVVEFAHGVAPVRAARISPQTFAAGVKRAARRAQFTWEQTSVLAAMPRVRQPVLFFHGAKDTWLSPEHSRALFARAAEGSRLVILPEDTHLSLAIRLQPIADEVQVWFAQHLVRSGVSGVTESSVREVSVEPETPASKTL